MPQYDKIAADYIKVQNKRPLRRCLLEPTFKKYIGDVRGLKVMDVGCGNGIYTRMLAQMGVAEVIGNDVSAAMIAQAKKEETKNPLGIKYDVYDLAKLPKLGEFDLVTSRAVIHYAKTKAELAAMFTSIYKNLRPGGRLVALIQNPDFDPKRPSRKYGYVQQEFPETPHDGDPVTITLEEQGVRVSFSCCYWSRSAYEEAAKQAGFQKFSWEKLVCSPECDQEFWQGYIKNPGLVPIVCVR